MDTRFPVPALSGDGMDPVERLSAYRLALEAMRKGREDVARMRGDPALAEVAGQLLRATASVAANIAEGYSRGSPSDRRKFLEYALGSTRESIVWYEASELAEKPERLDRLVSIRRLLLTMIRSARTDSARDRQKWRR
ncbi:MAG: four helix bundle protein [Gemmatimonadaceae bacterium]|nr:four helix bundle protein [Gemmatimonadaceae bacterium]